MSKPRQRVYANIANDPEYSAGPKSKRLKTYGVSNGGPNEMLRGNLEVLRRRTRHAFRNSPLVRRAIKAGVANEIGTGIIPRFGTSNESAKESLRELFDLFSKECDAEGQLDLYGLQAAWSSARRVSGEVFIRRRPRRSSEGLAVPFQLQTLESDFVPVALNETRRNGNKIIQGIEFNKRSKRVAYWMYVSHPGESNDFNASKLIRVPAKDVIHHYRAERPGQVRGEPLGVSGLVTLTKFESYNSAELTRKETKSGYTGMLTRNDLEDDDWEYDPITGEKLDADADGATSTIRSGTIVTAPAGTNLTMFDGDNNGTGYKEFIKEKKLELAVSYEIPYELMAGDWSGINDRIYRALIQEYRRGVRMDQDNLVIFQILNRIKEWFVESVVSNRLLRLPNYSANKHDYGKCEWRPEAWKHIHPVQDIQALVMAKDNDLASGDGSVAEMGYDAEVIDLQNALAERRRKDLREKYELGPKENSKGGEPPPDEEDEDEDDKPA
jgi:lambda family phage portal protein